ncbi:hypothetical protein [Guptibacillus hwajinpoensis]|uniref:hypothetical protein n=1 Tax=Guptibacillus hwajinpoensis TaxID=208199 RepID=UPI001CFF12F2|nr:hypothetical protein [Pseudalkalibacillus hwajinpoensis]WLR60171.1 hypothetical protein LC071_01905 [Pseudalkalibacillus hwajinpoensis]
MINIYNDWYLLRDENDENSSDLKAKLSEFNKQYEEVMKIKAVYKRDVALASIMTKMEGEFKISLLNHDEWQRNNPEIGALYRKISFSRSN